MTSSRNLLSPPLLLLAAVSLLILSAACGRSSQLRSTLVHAEAIMEEHPDSAYALLAPLHVDTNAAAEDRALHALLLTQAMHKTHFLVEFNQEAISCADSLINVASSFFEGANDEKHLMKSYYYRGVLLSMDDENYSSALIPLSRSLEIALDLNDSFWIAKNYDCIGDVFFQGNSFRDMIAAQEKALEYFTLSGREEFMNWARLSLSQSQISVGDLKEARRTIIPILDNIRDEAEGDSLLIGQAKQILAKISFYQGDYQECVSILSGTGNLNDLDSESAGFLIGSFIELDSVRKARDLYKQLLPQLEDDEVIIIDNLFAQKRGGIENVEDLKRMYDNLATDYRKTVETDFNTIQMSIAREVSKRNRESRERQIKYASSIVVILVLIATLLEYILRKRRKILAVKLDTEIDRRKEVERQMEATDRKNKNAIEKLQEDVEAHKNLLSFTESRLEEKTEEARKASLHAETIMQRKEIDEINRFVSYYYANEREPDMAEMQILNEIRKKIERYGPSKKKNVVFAADINSRFENILTHLRDDFPTIKENVISVVMYYLMGFSYKTIAYFTECKDERSVVNQMYQLRKKIEGLPDEKKKNYEILLSDSR